MVFAVVGIVFILGLVMWLGYVLFRSEVIVLRAHQANVSPLPGLRLALSYAAGMEGGSRFPAIAVLPDTLPMAKVVRRPFGPGTLIVSQGLLSTFQDDELVAVMQRGLKILSQRGVTAKSACSASFTRLERVRRHPWTPLRALLSWTLLPLRTFLERQDRALNIFRAEISGSAVEDSAWLGALHKVSCSERIFS